jgi:hypothetical protein
LYLTLYCNPGQYGITTYRFPGIGIPTDSKFRSSVADEDVDFQIKPQKPCVTAGVAGSTSHLLRDSKCQI